MSENRYDDDRFDYEIVDGKKIRVRPTEKGSEVDEYGYFRRQRNHFTRAFADANEQSAASSADGKTDVQSGFPLKAEPYRYRLIWAKGCHWSNRASIVRELLGLQDVISVNLAGHGEHEKNLGWEFVFNDGFKDPLTGDRFLSEAYYRADWEYGGRTTVPALIDLKAEGGPAVVNNDYNWLTVYFETAFRPYHRKGAPDLYPEALRKEIDAENFCSLTTSTTRSTAAGSAHRKKVTGRATIHFMRRWTCWRSVCLKIVFSSATM